MVNQRGEGHLSEGNETVGKQLKVIDFDNLRTTMVGGRSVYHSRSEAES